jgi:hypothetical protein
VDQHGEKFGIYRPMKQIDPAHVQPFGAWHDVALNLRSKEVESTFLPASVNSTETEKPLVTSLVETRSGVSEAQFDCVRSRGGHFRLAGLSHHPHMVHGFPGAHMHRALLFHGGRLHRFGRRRLIVEFSDPEKHASAETVPVADQTGGNGKAEASNKNRGDAGQHKVADDGHAEKRQGNHGKEAAQGTDHAPRHAKAQEAKANGKETNGQTRPQKVADNKHPQKRAADASKHQAKAGQAKTAQAKAKGRVADHQDASSNKKL